MNAERRKQIAEALTKIGEAKTTLEIVRDEEEEAKEALPEQFQDGERGDKMQAANDAMEESIDDIDTITDRLENL